MSVVVNKRSIMTMYSDSTDIYSHRVRIVLAEKGVAVDIISVDVNNKPEDLIDLNPYGSLPTLVDRDLVLYESNIIMEYLDERFPHPPLLPVYPVLRAKTRLMMYRVNNDWMSLVHTIQSGSAKKSEAAKEDLRNSLIRLAPAFASSPFFMSEEFTLVDCCIAPILWRLPQYGIVLPKQAKAVLEYADRIFERDSFQASISEVELEMREMAMQEIA